jgi:Uma2 family endonuclease
MLAERRSVTELSDRIGSGGTPMVEGVFRRLFTSAEYHAMAEAGILSEDERVELIAGEIVRMAPIGSRHAGCVKRLNGRLSRLGERALVSVQDPIALSPSHEPEPDLALLHPRADDYAQSHPAPSDIFLVIEVADFSVEYDRDVKIPLYARAGIPEAWLVDLIQRAVEVYREPSGDRYRDVQILRSGDSLYPQAFPDFELTVDAILGTGTR